MSGERWSWLAPAVLAGALVAVAASCSGSGATPESWRSFVVDGRPVSCVRVLAPSEYERGLMGYRGGDGAAFRFPAGRAPAFWMKDTPEDLVSVWVDRSGRVEASVPMAAETLTAHHVDGGTVLVVEVPSSAGVHPAAGAAAGLGGRCRS